MNKENKKNNCNLYIFLLTSMAILTMSLKEYIIEINYIKISYSIFVLPFTYLLVNYIYKKSSYKKALIGIIVSATSTVFFNYIIAFSLKEEFIISNIIGEFCAYILSQFIGLNNYHFMNHNTKYSFLLVYLNYLLSLVLFYLVFIVSHLETWNISVFEEKYSPILLITTIICIPLSLLDRKHY